MSKKINTIQDLAARLSVVEAKLNTLSGFESIGVDASSIQELNIRLSIVENAVDTLIEKPAVDAVAELVAAPAYQSPIAIDEVVALSPAAEVPAAAAIVTDVIAAQAASEAPADEQVAEVVTAAVAAVVNAEAEVVTDSSALIAAIVEAVADAQTVSEPASSQAAIDAVPGYAKQLGETALAPSTPEPLRRTTPEPPADDTKFINPFDA